MAYAIKYQITYKKLSDTTTTIDIYKRDYVGSITELMPTDDPLNIDFGGNEQNIYEPTQGSGATIRVLGDPLTLLDLFTEDPQEFIVNVYNENTLIWHGFVSPNIYSEDYSVISPVQTPITIQCNDGMELLNYIPYTTSAGESYSGFTYIAGIMRTIIEKLSITFDEIITATDLMVTTGYTNLFLGLTVNNENFYDEKGQAMTCREVLNSVFGGLGLVMFFQAEKIYVINPVQLTTPSIAKAYVFHSGYTFAESDVTLGGFKLIGDDLPWFETGQQLDIVRPFNQIEVKYDPYTIEEIAYDFDADENTPEEQYVGWQSGYTSAVHTYNFLVDHPITKIKYPNTFGGWVSSNETTTGVDGIAQVNRDDSSKYDKVGAPQYYFRFQSAPYKVYNEGEYWEYEFPYSQVVQDSQVFLECTFDVFVNTKNAYNIIDPIETGTEISEMKLGNIELMCGDKWYDIFSGYWYSNRIATSINVIQTDADRDALVGVRSVPAKSRGTLWDLFFHPRQHVFFKYTDGRIDDRWTTVSFTALLSDEGLSSAIKGPIKLRIYRNMRSAAILSPPGDELPYTVVQSVLFKNPVITFLNLKKARIQNTGKSIIALLNNNIQLKQADLNITLTNGTGKYGCSRAAFSSDQMSIPGLTIPGVYRTGSTISYDTMEIVAQQLLTQYKVARKKLDVNIDVKTDLLANRFKILNDRYLPGVNFYVVGGSYNDRDENLKCTLIELSTTYEELPIPTPEPTYVLPTPTPLPDCEEADFCLGFKSQGIVNIADQGDLVLDFTITGYCSASQSWINCNYPPEAYAYLTYQIDGTTITESAQESGAYEGDKDRTTTTPFTYNFTSIVSGDTNNLISDISNEYTYCGDAWGTIYMEITSVTKVSGTGTVAIDPNNSSYFIQG